MGRTTRQAPTLLLAAAMAAAAVLYLALTWRFTFLLDSWEFLMNRRGFTADAFLQPHNEHIVLFPVAIEQLLLHLFGMSSAKPEFVLLTIGLLVTAYLVFVYVSRRLGPWFGLFAAALILFLGPAWELILWPFEIGLLGSVLFGLAMLLALERGDRRGDVLACVCLAVSLGFSSLGISFAMAALVAILLSPRERRRGRAFVFVIPVALFAVWYLGWGHNAESHLSLRHVLASPRFVAESIAAGVGNLFGFGNNPVGATGTFWGAILLVAIVGSVWARQQRRPGFDPDFWPVAAAAATNWFLTAFNQMPGREPASSRYQYASAIFIVLMLANLLAKERFGRRAVLVGAAVTLLAIGLNLVVLRDGRDFLETQSVLTRADTGAIEIARRTVAPEFELGPDVAGTTGLVNVFAGKYLEAVDEYGSPAYTPGELETAPAYARKRVDVILGQALPLSTTTQAGVYQRGAGQEGCVAIVGGKPEEVRVDPGLTRIEVAPGPNAALSLRRFAEGEYPVATAGAPGESTTTLKIPHDEAPQPWYLHLEATQSVRVCR